MCLSLHYLLKIAQGITTIKIGIQKNFYRTSKVIIRKVKKTHKQLEQILKNETIILINIMRSLK